MNWVETNHKGPRFRSAVHVNGAFFRLSDSTTGPVNPCKATVHKVNFVQLCITSCARWATDFRISHKRALVVGWITTIPQIKRQYNTHSVEKVMAEGHKLHVCCMHVIESGMHLNSAGYSSNGWNKPRLYCFGKIKASTENQLCWCGTPIHLRWAPKNPPKCLLCDSKTWIKKIRLRYFFSQWKLCINLAAFFSG